MQRAETSGLSIFQLPKTTPPTYGWQLIWTVPYLCTVNLRGCCSTGERRLQPPDAHVTLYYTVQVDLIKWAVTLLEIFNITSQTDNSYARPRTTTISQATTLIMNTLTQSSPLATRQLNAEV